VVVDKKEVGKVFKGDSKFINETIENWSEEDHQKYKQESDQNGEIVLTTADGR